MRHLARYRQPPTPAELRLPDRNTRDPDYLYAEHPLAPPKSDLWTLYAISRVSDFLLDFFQAPPGEPAPFLGFSEATYVQFFEALGLQTFDERSFSPFFHEIVEVEPVDDPSGGVEIVRQFWPGLMFGSLMVARAGVGVRCHPSIIRKDVAETSPLYFAYGRRRRLTVDLSMGAGHNSQWQTEFRRDYVDGDLVHFNVDGRIDLSGSEPTPVDEDPNAVLSIEARRELLMNRCLVTAPEPGQPGELYPFYDRLTVLRAGGSLLPSPS